MGTRAECRPRAPVGRLRPMETVPVETGLVRMPQMVAWFHRVFPGGLATFRLVNRWVSAFKLFPSCKEVENSSAMIAPSAGSRRTPAGSRGRAGSTR